MQLNVKEGSPAITEWQLFFFPCPQLDESTKIDWDFCLHRSRTRSYTINICEVVEGEIPTPAEKTKKT